jgi:hypothetical protein
MSDNTLSTAIDLFIPEPSELLSEEIDLGELTETANTQYGSVGDTNTSDLYRFNLASNSDINIALTNLSADADVRLIRDDNNNGVIDEGEEIARSAFGDNFDESINLNNQAAGNYFVQVYQYSGETDYTLNLSNADPSNLLSQETDLGVLVGGDAIANFGSVSDTNTSELYHFSLESSGMLQAMIDGLSADADLRLISDANSNGIIDAGEELARSSLGGTTSDSINIFLNAGDYFLQAYQYSGTTDYNLNASISPTETIEF